MIELPVEDGRVDLAKVHPLECTSVLVLALTPVEALIKPLMFLRSAT